jgi:predicted molibdopterin-dependent oxidoreductase YjgC
LFKQIGVKQVVFQRPKPGKSDALLLQADKSPNARGAQALGVPEGAQALLDRAANKQLRVLWIIGQDLTQVFDAGLVRKAAQSLELLVFQGPNTNATADLAHLVLPAAAYAEKDGTFTNFQGRVQRIRAAFVPMGEAKPDWEIFQLLGKHMKCDIPFADAAAVFAQLAKESPAFAGMTHDTLGEQGKKLSG